MTPATLLLSGQPASEDDPTPTSAHISLKNLIDKLINDVNEHPVANVSESLTEGVIRIVHRVTFQAQEALSRHTLQNQCVRHVKYELDETVERM